jgi:hypothetical protein
MRERLGPQVFWQIHCGAVVSAAYAHLLSEQR